MIGILPKTLIVNNKERDIKFDWITCYNIMAMMQDPNFEDYEKEYGLLDLLFVDGVDQFTEDDLLEANEKACAFLDGSFYRVEQSDSSIKKGEPTKLIDWDQDESLIISAIAAGTGHDIRNDPNMHWWTFLSFFTEIPATSTLSFIINIREKIFKGKKPEDYEKEFIKKNKHLIYFNIQKELTDEEKQAREELKNLVGI